MTGIDRILAAIETAAMIVLTLSALATGIMQVVLRYAFNTGLPCSGSVFVTLTIWAMLLVLGMPIAVLLGESVIVASLLFAPINPAIIGQKVFANR